MGMRQAMKKVLYALKPNYVRVTVAQVQSGNTLCGKKIVIIGGTRGLGRAMAEKFLAEGATVLITGRSQQTVDSAVAAIGSDRLHTKVFDANDTAAMPEFMDWCFSRLGGVDAFVSNAGISLHEGTIQRVTPEGFDLTVSTNLKSHYFAAKAFLEWKVALGGDGVLLFVTSKDGFVCNETPYGLTKAAVNSLVGGLSTAYYRRGIRVNAIAPGVTITDMTAMYAKKANGNMYAANYAGRNFIPEEVAEVACFLVGDASKCISGQIIYTDGGDHIKSNVEVL